MQARSIKELEAVWSKLDRSKWLTDNIIGIGGVGIGLNGLVAMVTSAIPGFGILGFEAFTLIVAAYLLSLAVRARAAPSTILWMLVVLGLDASFDLLDVIPFLGGIVDTVFRGPLLAARLLQHDIERTHWVEGSRREAMASGAHVQHLAEMRAQKKRRVVYLGD
jgi:hypothetical protein